MSEQSRKAQREREELEQLANKPVGRINQLSDKPVNSALDFLTADERNKFRKERAELKSELATLRAQKERYKTALEKIRDIARTALESIKRGEG